jgi:hypothetical protein
LLEWHRDWRFLLDNQMQAASILIQMRGNTLGAVTGLDVPRDHHRRAIGCLVVQCLRIAWQRRQRNGDGRSFAFDLDTGSECGDGEHTTRIMIDQAHWNLCMRLHCDFVVCAFAKDRNRLCLIAAFATNLLETIRIDIWHRRRRRRRRRWRRRYYCRCRYCRCTCAWHCYRGAWITGVKGWCWCKLVTTKTWWRCHNMAITNWR